MYLEGQLWGASVSCPGYSIWKSLASVNTHSGLSQPLSQDWKWRHLHFSPGELSHQLRLWPSILLLWTFVYSSSKWRGGLHRQEDHSSRAPDSRPHLISCLSFQVLWPKHWHAYLLVNLSCNLLLPWAIVQFFSSSHWAIPPFSLTPRTPLKALALLLSSPFGWPKYPRQNWWDWKIWFSLP